MDEESCAGSLVSSDDEQPIEKDTHGEAESDDDDELTMDEIMHGMATINNGIDGSGSIKCNGLATTDGDDGNHLGDDDDFDQDEGLAEIARLMHQRRQRLTASETLSRALKQHDADAEAGSTNICEEDDTDDELAVAGSGDAKEPEFVERTVQIAVDSGAGKNVAPPDLIEGYTVTPSYGSRHNKHFVAANGGKILNLGETSLNFNDGSGSRMRSTFQVAEVSRMLYSVSQLCDAGCDVSFNKDEGRVTKDGKTLAKFPRKGGLYVMTTTLKAPTAHKQRPDTGFARQG